MCKLSITKNLHINKKKTKKFKLNINTVFKFKKH